MKWALLNVILSLVFGTLFATFIKKGNESEVNGCYRWLGAAAVALAALLISLTIQHFVEG